MTDLPPVQKELLRDVTSGAVNFSNLLQPQSSAGPELDWS